jgi:hypothetical protein
MVGAFATLGAASAWDARFKSNFVTGLEVFHGRTNFCDNPRGFMPEHHGTCKNVFSYPTALPVMNLRIVSAFISSLHHSLKTYITAADASLCNPHNHVMWMSQTRLWPILEDDFLHSLKN